MSESGHLKLDGDVIRYRSPKYDDWTVPVSDVRMIGEVTSQSGPFADDYFFCFATGPGLWLEASFFAAGRDEFLQALGAKIGSPIEPVLCHSTDFASQILWPPSLAGKPMFRFDVTEPKGLLGKVFGPWQNRQTYTAEVVEILAHDG